MKNCRIQGVQIKETKWMSKTNDAPSSDGHQEVPITFQASAHRGDSPNLQQYLVTTNISTTTLNLSQPSDTQARLNLFGFLHICTRQAAEENRICRDEWSYCRHICDVPCQPISFSTCTTTFPSWLAVKATTTIHSVFGTFVSTGNSWSQKEWELKDKA